MLNTKNQQTINNIPTDIIDLVIPCYNEEDTIELFYTEYKKLREQLVQRAVQVRVIFVNDGSKDRTEAIIEDLQRKDKNISYINFSRNFGKEGAMLAGLEASQGDFVAVMDVDGQDPLYLIPEMYDTIKNQAGMIDCVASRRKDRTNEPIVKSYLQNKFYDIQNKISSTKIVNGARDFRLMTRSFVDQVISLREVNRFQKGLFNWVGYNTEWISYNNIERNAGTSKFNFKKLFRYALDGFVEYSNFPLFIPALIGCITFSLQFICFILGSSLKAVILSSVFMGIGFLLVITVIPALYLEKIYDEIKNRPKYLVKQTGGWIN